MIIRKAADGEDNYVLSFYKVGVVHLLAVHPAIHGKGVGKALLRKAVELSREQGDEVVRLDTLTWNLPGHRLYEGFGFRCCGDYDMTYPTTGTIPFRMFEWKHEHETHAGGKKSPAQGTAGGAGRCLYV